MGQPRRGAGAGDGALSLLAVAVAVLVGSMLQSATGFGFALVTAPAIFAVFSPGEALTCLALLSCVLSMLVLFGERREVTIRKGDVARLVLWGVPGLAAGVLILRAVDKPVLQVGVGLAVVTAAVIEARALTRTVAATRPWPAAPLGLVAGAMTTTTGVNGPVYVMFFLRSGADQHQVRDSLAATFLLITPMSLGALAAAGRLGFGHVGFLEVLVLVVLVAVGRPLGRALFLRLTAARFRTLGVVLSLVAGGGSIVAGLA